MTEAISTSTSTSARAIDIRELFKQKLIKEWQHQAVCGHSYILVVELERWMSRTEPGQMNNCARLLQAVFKDSSRPEHEFQPLTSPEVLTVEKHCYRVFSILLEQNRGHLLELFRQAGIFDNNLDSADYHYSDLRRLLANWDTPDVESIITDFDARKLSYCPAEIVLRSGSFDRRKWILPFSKKQAITEKGGTANLWQVLVKREVLPDDLRVKLKEEEFRDKDFGWCYQFALKEYDRAHQVQYIDEKQAFKVLSQQQGLVQYLGDFSHGDEDDWTYNILLEYGEEDLDEYFAGVRKPPVLPEEIISFYSDLFEIAKALQQLHTGQFKNEDGYSQNFEGWHADVKPDNILRVRGKFKLADFGFARLKKSTSKASGGYAVQVLNGGTETYGAPETDRSRRQGTLTPVSQTIDTWSFGCVLSMAATWVVHGSQAIVEYESLRIEAIKARKRVSQGPQADDAFHDGVRMLPEVLEWHKYLARTLRGTDTTTKRVLDLVEQCMLIEDPTKRTNSRDLCTKLKDIITCAREDAKGAEAIPENVIRVLVDIDEQAQAAPDANAAVNGGHFPEHLSKGVSANGSLISAPLSALPVPHAPRIRSSRRIDKSKRMDAMYSLVKTTKRSGVGRGSGSEDGWAANTAPSNLITSSPREVPSGFGVTHISESPTEHEPIMLDKNPRFSGLYESPIGQLTSDPLSGGKQSHGSSQQSSNSSGLVGQSAQGLYFPESHIAEPERVLNQTFDPSQSKEPDKYITLDQSVSLADHSQANLSDIPIIKKISVETLDKQRSSKDRSTQDSQNRDSVDSPGHSSSPANPLSPPLRASSTPQEHSTKLADKQSLLLNISMEGQPDVSPQREDVEQAVIPKNATAQQDALPQAENEKPEETPSHPRIDEHGETTTPLLVIAPSSGVEYIAGDSKQVPFLNIRTPSDNSLAIATTVKSDRVPRHLDIWKVRQEVDLKRKGKVNQVRSFLGIGIRTDDDLRDYIRDRDIVFVVDNGSSMRPHWDQVTFTLETLYLKLDGLDKNGVDLVFTTRYRCNREELKGKAGFKEIGRMMADALPDLPKDDPTNMDATLGLIFQKHLEKVDSRRDKRTTLIILTDGLWEATEQDGVDKKITDFYRKLPEKVEDRWFSIQFVSFGFDQEALDRLQRLDDDLEKTYKIPDIVDTEHWEGDVVKMILGSLRREIDVKPSGSPSTPTKNSIVASNDNSDMLAKGKGGKRRSTWLPGS